MRFDDNYGADPNYVNSSLQPTMFYPEVKNIKPSSISLHTEHEKWVGEVSAFTSHITDDDFVQPAELWKVLGRQPGEQEMLVGNLAASIKGVKSSTLRNSVYALFARVNKDLSARVQKATEEAIEQ
ncbi:Catalase mono-functional heme-containing [Penicillium herquei]|nr:Catalase mono-functional heme-containing [Penicillium herquei]